MSGPSDSALAPILVLLLVVATDLWVYADARAHRERGTPVVFSAGSLNVDTPVAWFLGCLLLWVLFFPLYITRRRPSRTRWLDLAHQQLRDDVGGDGEGFLVRLGAPGGLGDEVLAVAAGQPQPAVPASLELLQGVP